MARALFRRAAVACALAGWWGVGGACPQLARGGGFTLTKVVDRNTLVPGTSQGFGYLWLPALDGGNLAFAGGPFIGTGIYKRVNGQVMTVADGATPIPGEPYTFAESGTSFTGLEPQISGTTAAFSIELFFSSTAIYWDGIGSLAAVVDRHTSMPYGDPESPDFHQFPEDYIVLQNSGFQLSSAGVVFPWLTPGFNPDNLAEPCLTDLNGVYRRTATGLETLADNSTVARCQGGGFWQFFGKAALDGERVAFSGARVSAEGFITDRGLYVRDLVSGVDELVVASGATVADGGVTPSPLFPAEARQLGPDYLDFLATSTAGLGAYRYQAGSITTIFDEQSTLPGPDIGPWTLSSIALDGDQFAVSVANDADGIAAVYSNLGGELARVIGTGDLLNGEPVVLAAAGAYGLDGNQLAVLVAQASGFSIYLATPTPDPLVGDANGDCTVGAADYAIWAAQFGQTGAGLSADFDGNGSVGAGDYALWAANFGRTCPAGEAASVPEPGTAGLAVSALAALVLYLARPFWLRGRRLRAPSLQSQM